LEVAQERDTILLDITPVATSRWRVINLNPKERHRSDVFADFDFQGVFKLLDFRSLSTKVESR
jgi:hypothetical protein